ncbi:MAG: TolC family protein [Gemmataceae bacterium]
MKPRPPRRSRAAFALAALTGLLCLTLCALSVQAEAEGALPPPSQLATLKLGAAVQWALEHNPALLTFRKNRGIAQAAVQIARQYPFNPIIQDYVWYAQGAPVNRGASVTNPIFNEHTMRLDLELRHQGRYRRAMAQAALTRTEWEIAAQELLTSILVTRAFNTLLYRQGKYRLLEEGTQLTEQIAGLTEQLFAQGNVTSADLLLAQADVVEARNSLGPGRGAVIVAENDLRRALGILGESFAVVGTLEKGYVAPPADLLVQAAMERRPDLHALEFAVREAEQRQKLEIANRYGNPSLGPAMEYNETNVIFTGMWLIWQLPIINQRKGEIRQRQAEVARAGQAMQQGEISVRQDVFAAVARLSRAEEAVKTFTTQTLPTLRKTREELDKLYVAKQTGIDLAGIISIRRRLLTARDGYLDALWDMSQAQVDLAAAVADLSFAGCRAATLASEAEPSNTPSPTQEQPPNGEQLPPPTPVPGK